jgi:hypothetical protein
VRTSKKKKSGLRTLSQKERMKEGGRREGKRRGEKGEGEMDKGIVKKGRSDW